MDAADGAGAGLERRTSCAQSDRGALGPCKRTSLALASPAEGLGHAVAAVEGVACSPRMKQSEAGPESTAFTVSQLLQ